MIKKKKKNKNQGDGEKERLSLSSAVKVIVGQQRSHGCRAVWRDSLQSLWQMGFDKSNWQKQELVPEF